MRMLIFTLVALLTWSAVSAQWSTDLQHPLLLSEDVDNTGMPSVVEDGQGGVYVFWTSGTGFGPLGSHIMGQHLDGQGYPQWEPGGRILVQGGYYELSPSMAALPGGGFLLCWMETFDNVTTYAMMQRFDADGLPDWQQPAQLGGSGGPYADARYMNFFVNGNSAFVGFDCWTGQYIDVRLARVDLDGTVVWGYNGILVEDTSSVGLRASLVPDHSSGGYFLYRHYIQGQGEMLRVQRFNANGDLLWPGGLVISDQYPVNTDNTVQLMASVGQHDAVTLYKGEGYAGPLVLTRLDTNGVAVWSPADRLIEGSDSTSQSYAMSADGEEVLTSWFRSPPQDDMYPYHVQRLGEQGNELWPAGGVQPLTSTVFDAGVVIHPWSAGGSLLFADLPGGFAVRRIAQDGALSIAPVFLSDTSLWFDVVTQQSALIQLDDALVGALQLNGQDGDDIAVFRLAEPDLPMAVSATKSAVVPRAYPVPADASIRVPTALEGQLRLLIADACGHVVERGTIVPNGRVQITVDRYPPGAYFLELSNDHGSQRTPFIVQH